jgi:hypothetical protein
LNFVVVIVFLFFCRFIKRKTGRFIVRQATCRQRKPFTDAAPQI